MTRFLHCSMMLLLILNVSYSFDFSPYTFELGRSVCNNIQDRLEEKIEKYQNQLLNIPFDEFDLNDHHKIYEGLLLLAKDEGFRSLLIDLIIDSNSIYKFSKRFTVVGAVQSIISDQRHDPPMSTFTKKLLDYSAQKIVTNFIQDGYASGERDIVEKRVEKYLKHALEILLF